jgi:hypothetical protein
MSSFNGLPVVRQREAEDAKLDWSVMWRVPCGIHQEEDRKNRSNDWTSERSQTRKSSLQYGTTYDQPVLSVDEAWDVAAYVESMKRPQKAGLDKDFPVRTEKPVDAGYGPYIDGFSQDQHKFGPFQPIRNELKAMKTPTAAEKTKPAIQ